LVRAKTLGRVAAVCRFPLSRLWFVGGLLCAVVFDSQAALGASFVWSAPAVCPTDAEVRARVETGLGVGLADLPDIAFDASAREAEHGFELELKARRGEANHLRRIRAKTCAELVDVLVAAMSLALESLGSERRRDEPRPPADESAEPAGNARPEAAKASAPTPGTRVPSKSAPSSRLSGWVAAAGLVDAGALPEPAPGAQLRLGVGWRMVQARAIGVMIPQERAALKGTTEGDFDLVAAGVGLCAASVRAFWEARFCLDGELGRLRGEGVRVRNARKASSAWLAAAPELELLVRPDVRGWALFAGVGATVPLYRKSFVLTDLGDVHTPASPGLRVAVGVEVELW
jgi:hypothetical protein